jgi:drug/metabolite transporter (DMT)-like permease
VTVLLALSSALMFGAGVALQHRAAVAVPSELAARPGLLVRLVHRPLWLGGLMAEIAGFGLQALALYRGSLVVVQPLITTSLLFTLVFVALLERTSLAPAEWMAVVAVLTGLGVFLIVAQPVAESRAVADGEGWLLVTVAVAVTVTVTAGAALRSTGLTRVGLFSLAAGVADAFMAVLAKSFAGAFDAGVGHVFTSWTPYAVVGGGLVAMLLTATAYQAGHATLALPIITVTDPVIGSVIGILLFGEHLHLGGVRGPVVALGLLAVVAGVTRLARQRRLADVVAGSAPPERTGAGSR